MKFKTFIFIIAAIFVVQIVGAALFLNANPVPFQDTVEINDILQDCTANFADLNKVEKTYKYDFSILDNSGNLLLATKKGLSGSINEAIKNRDTILDVILNSTVMGKLIISSNYSAAMNTKNLQLIIFTGIMLSITAAVLIGYIAFINKRIIRPFNSLNGFATKISNGNLDLQLNMDKKNIFGAFTESFDIMRDELKKAREAEQKANESKKQLIANLSHDIKTPVSSIKAIAELEEVKALQQHKHIFSIINKKADQVNELVSNLFSATLEELNQLNINEGEYNSNTLPDLINSADYLKLAEIDKVPEMLLTFDKQRLQQVIDNIISNSYKYANTKIKIHFECCGKLLIVRIKDFGGYDDNPSELTSKFYRGKNATGRDGAGLGLYISKHLMTAMGGNLTLDSSANNFCVELSIKIS